MKKNIFTLLFLASALGCFGQGSLTFTYDVAGNQTNRHYIVVSNKLANRNVKQIKDLVEADLKTSDVSEEIKFYPNPVQEDLFIQWIETEVKKETQLQLFDMNGQLLKTYFNLPENNSMTINFQVFPSGIFNLILDYSNGEIKILKVVK